MKTLFRLGSWLWAIVVAVTFMYPSSLLSVSLTGVSYSVIAPSVPVVLNALASEDDGSSVSFAWSQVSGHSLEMLGPDRSNPIILPSTNTGVFRFEVLMFRKTGAVTNKFGFTLEKEKARVLYVDNRLPGHCLNGTYSITRRDCSGTDGIAFRDLQSAADSTLPGDTVLVRGGVYTNHLRSGTQIRLLQITRSGTAASPIRYHSFPGERVVLQGLGYEDRDLNDDGYADGPRYPSKRETLLQIAPGANYIHIRGLELMNSQGIGLEVSGNYCYIEECTTRDNWYAGATIYHGRTTNALVGTVLRWVESRNNRHGGGATFSMDNVVFGFTHSCAIVDGIFYRNGYQPDGKQVLPTPYDPAGGGNSDGTGASKDFSDSAVYNPGYGIKNWGVRNYIVRNISFGNCDDGFDSSISESVFEDNYSLFNGPTGRKGFKMLRAVTGIVYRGNLAFGNDSVGFDLRAPDGESVTVVQNTALDNGGQGFLGPTRPSVNNVAAFNAFGDFGGGTGNQTGNWSAQNSGDPMIADRTLLALALSPVGDSVQARRNSVESTIRRALSPTKDSPLVDRGVLIQGYHCPRADDDPVNPMPRNAFGRHWRGQAPDLGAFEFTPATPSSPSNVRIK